MYCDQPKLVRGGFAAGLDSSDEQRWSTGRRWLKKNKVHLSIKKKTGSDVRYAIAFVALRAIDRDKLHFLAAGLATHHRLRHHRCIYVFAATVDVLRNLPACT